ncbi:hypothetical protein JKF63_00775 [Porcisia hertigi]|uniref:Uncharacterized protein n=1 Tax=Porcisia hertigi TaxID=2761500 RepID=A0A836HZP0_9TRYP|nr:hypothetical protein JKF63_00775 [Porcisia hertigi]
MATIVSSNVPSLSRDLRIRSASSYRHDPYAFSLLEEKDRDSAAESFRYIYNVLAKEKKSEPMSQEKEQRRKVTKGAPVKTMDSKFSSSCPTPDMEHLDTSSTKSGTTADSGNDDGVSEASSESGSQHTKEINSTVRSGFSVTGAHSHPASSSLTSGATAVPAVIRYASVNFRFGSAWFIAPFRTFTGDMVVAQYPGNNGLHMGLVSAITTAKPITFYTEDNMDPNYLSPEEMLTVPRLLRHARDFDKETKLDLRSHDLRSLANARKLAAELGVPVQFLDAEWLLDLSAVTFLVKVFGDKNLVDRLVDELALHEGAEVVFTYPVSSAAMY